MPLICRLLEFACVVPDVHDEAHCGGHCVILRALACAIVEVGTGCRQVKDAVVALCTTQSPPEASCSGCRYMWVNTAMWWYHGWWRHDPRR
eukprot:11984527-Alexandrium_andersonii.AAC.1